MTSTSQSGTPGPSHKTRSSPGSALSQEMWRIRRAVAPPPRRPAPTPAAAPPARPFFDPWNSSSTGHQRAENRLAGSTSWRASRNLKLGQQYKGGLGGGGKRVADTVGAGSEEPGKGGRKANGNGGQQSLAEVWGASKAGKKLSSQDKHISKVVLSHHAPEASTDDGGTMLTVSGTPLLQSISAKPAEKQIFAGLCFYINGSTAPLVSDHKLKHMLAAHGAKLSITLGRRSVSHVILAQANLHGGVAGGGLSATKLQKEITKSGGKAVKFVTAAWVLDSIQANRRLPESRFSPLMLVPENQNSVLGMFCATRDPG